GGARGEGAALVRREPLGLVVERGLELAARRLEVGIDRVELAQLLEPVARVAEVARRDGRSVVLAQRGLALRQRSRELLHVVERRGVARLEREREPVVQDRLGEPVALLEVARALLALLDEADGARRRP